MRTPVSVARAFGIASANNVPLCLKEHVKCEDRSRNSSKEKSGKSGSTSDTLVAGLLLEEPALLPTTALARKQYASRST